jgi:hypothetical protein
MTAAAQFAAHAVTTHLIDLPDTARQSAALYIIHNPGPGRAHLSTEGKPDPLWLHLPGGAASDGLAAKYVESCLSFDVTG